MASVSRAERTRRENELARSLGYSSFAQLRKARGIEKGLSVRAAYGHARPGELTARQLRTLPAPKPKLAPAPARPLSAATLQRQVNDIIDREFGRNVRTQFRRQQGQIKRDLRAHKITKAQARERIDILLGITFGNRANYYRSLGQGNVGWYH